MKGYFRKPQRREVVEGICSQHPLPLPHSLWLVPLVWLLSLHYQRDQLHVCLLVFKALVKFYLFQGIFLYCSKPHWPPRLVTTLAPLPASPGWPYYSDLVTGWDLFFPNHTMSRCHTFSISGSDVDHLCSGGGSFPNGAWKGRYFRLLSFFSEACPSTWGSSWTGKPELLTVKKVVWINSAQL